MEIEEKEEVYLSTIRMLLAMNKKIQKKIERELNRRAQEDLAERESKSMNSPQEIIPLDETDKNYNTEPLPVKTEYKPKK